MGKPISKKEWSLEQRKAKIIQELSIRSPFTVRISTPSKFPNSKLIFKPGSKNLTDLELLSWK